FAIAASSLNFGTNFNWHKKNYEQWKYHDTPLSGQFFSGLNDHLSLVNSAFALIVYQAVTQFSYVLKHLDPSTTFVVYYEDLVVDQERVFEEFETFFEQSLDLNVFQSALSKQSFSSQEGHTHSDAIAQLSKWKQKCSEADIGQGLRIFEAFDFKVYSDAILPVKQK